MERRKGLPNELHNQLSDILIQRDILAWVYFETMEPDEYKEQAIFKFLETIPYTLLQEVLPSLDIGSFTMREIDEQTRGGIREMERFHSYDRFIDYIKGNYHHVKVSLTHDGYELLGAYNQLLEQLDFFGISEEKLPLGYDNSEKFETAKQLSELFSHSLQPINLDYFIGNAEEPMDIVLYIEVQFPESLNT